MEWVETTGRTLDEAKDLALDRLGVDEADAEFEVIEEPRPGLFGRMRGEARVRARVRPTQPRPKVDRRDRRRRQKDAAPERAASRPDPAATEPPASPPPTEVHDVPAPAEPPLEASPSDAAPPATEAPPADPAAAASETAAAATAFLAGLAEAFGLTATASARLDGDATEAVLDGDDLGVLIGPRGQTLQAVQDLTRVVVNRTVGEQQGRLYVDVGGYRQRRREALAGFAEQVAAQVRATGTARALEPMHPADRKVVHDTVNAIDGVTTRSEGDEPHRRVVIVAVDG